MYYGDKIRSPLHLIKPPTTSRYHEHRPIRHTTNNPRLSTTRTKTTKHKLEPNNSHEILSTCQGGVTLVIQLLPEHAYIYDVLTRHEMENWDIILAERPITTHDYTEPDFTDQIQRRINQRAQTNPGRMKRIIHTITKWFQR